MAFTGRVKDADVGASPSFSLFADDGNGSGQQGDGPRDNGRTVDALIHSKPNDVSTIFFSDSNVDALQEAIRYRVYVESGSSFVIGRQSDVELGIVMRSYYLQEGRDRSGRDEVIAEVRRLNVLVLEFCVPRILQEADMYIKYRKDLSTLPAPMPRGELSTSKGTKTLELKRFI